MEVQWAAILRMCRFYFIILSHVLHGFRVSNEVLHGVELIQVEE